MNFRKDDIIFLIGAGASADAGIPVSSKMLEELEGFIKTKDEWKRYKDLYFLIKSGYEYSVGLLGNKSKFNIEVLVNILRELSKKEEHPLYPFIGSWNIRFNEVIKDNFNLIKDFDKKIVNQLKSWVAPDDLRKADYYKKVANYYEKLIEFRKSFNYSGLRLFSLNYDLCIEKKFEEKAKVERGFDEKRNWNHKRFSDLPEDEQPDFYLYKLHGSIDWERDSVTQRVTYTDNVPKNPDLIFGTQYKMQYIDPYLFLFSEFRHYAMNSKLIICLGYSFSDEHINAILSQSLEANKNLRIYSVSKGVDKNHLSNIFAQNIENIIAISDKGVKEFLENDLNIKTFKQIFPHEDGDIF